jgi:Sec-independent protein translocase protein TatA
MSKRWLFAVAIALPMLAGSLEAQGGVRTRPGALRALRRAEKEQKQEQKQEMKQEDQRKLGADAPVNQKNQLLQQQIRRTMWRVAKQRIGFTDDQMLRIERTSQRFDQQRRILAQTEVAQRRAMRTEILSDSANQGNITAALDQLHAVQQRRLDLQAEEQKEFATFMTPLQRAKYMALQEQVRRRLQELTRARPDSSNAKLPEAP